MINFGCFIYPYNLQTNILILDTAFVNVGISTCSHRVIINKSRIFQSKTFRIEVGGIRQSLNCNDKVTPELRLEGGILEELEFFDEFLIS